MITIINYGLGNVAAIATIYKHLGIPFRVATGPHDLARAERMILPGVGSFDWAAERLCLSGMKDLLLERIDAGAAVLGICVGMQLLADLSEEGVGRGLGLIPGRVLRFEKTRLALGLRVPHMGWNCVFECNSSPLFAGIADGSRFYFLHSYYYDPVDLNHRLFRTDFGGAFASGVCKGRVFGVQFHPEKSHSAGVELLRNFAKI